MSSKRSYRSVSLWITIAASELSSRSRREGMARSMESTEEIGLEEEEGLAEEKEAEKD